jgi:hypothetical protein
MISTDLAPVNFAAAAKAKGRMKGASTVIVTSPRRNFTNSAANIRTVNSSSARARLSNAALPGIQFPTSTA